VNQRNISILSRDGFLQSFSIEDLPPKYSEIVSRVSKIKSDSDLMNQHNIIVLNDGVGKEVDSKSLE